MNTTKQPSRPILALDFGGTKLVAAVVDVSSGRIAAMMRLPTPTPSSREASLEAMIRAGQQVLSESGLPVEAVGISFGGPVSPDRRSVLLSMHIPGWESFPLPDYLSQALGVPAYMDNDGNAAALGEWGFGAGRGAQNMLYAQVSTGIGGGLVLGGKVYRGSTLAGEFGHIPVLPDGPDCACGGRGCVESVASGWALARDGRLALEAAAPGSPLYRLGSTGPDSVDAQLIIEACRQGDPLAVSIVDHAMRGLGMALSAAIALLDPHCVVLGGGVMRAWDVLQPRLQAALAVHLLPMQRGRAVILQSELDGAETLLGAALLTLET